MEDSPQDDMLLKCIHDIEEERKSTYGYLAQNQQSSLDTILTLFKEAENGFRDSTGAKRSRHRAAHSVLSAILKKFNSATFLLCAISLSMTRLARIRTQWSGFERELEQWLGRAEIPDEFCRLANRVLSERGVLHKAVAQPSKRAACDAQQNFEPPAKRRLTTNDDEVIRGPALSSSTCSSSDTARHLPLTTRASTDLVSSSKTGTGSPKSDSITEEPTAERHLVDGPLDGAVYQLKPMDVIRVIATNDGLDFRLTMPNYDGHMPFITLQCPADVAAMFLPIRKKIM